MKKIIFLLSLLSASAFAVDYSAMTTTELQAMRGTVPAEDRAAYQAEMQTRMKAMTQEEKQSMMQKSGMGSAAGTGTGSGSGSGSGMGGGMGSGGGHGKGGR